MTPAFKKKLNRHDLRMGTIISLPAPEMAEILSAAGFDGLFVDFDHSAMSIRDAQVILQVAAPRRQASNRTCGRKAC